jgi:hypothetical protein
MQHIIGGPQSFLARQMMTGQSMYNTRICAVQNPAWMGGCSCDRAFILHNPVWATLTNPTKCLHDLHGDGHH